MNTLAIPFAESPWFWPLIVWSLIWKGLALWKAGTLRDKWWFVAILLINTFGVLEIVYYFVFSNRDRGGRPADLPPREKD